MNRVPWFVAGAVFGLSLMSQSFSAQRESGLLTDEDIRQILVERVDTYHQTVGIVAGLVGPEGRHVIAYGNLAANDPRPVDGNTVFEVGSITKVFTSLLLADMVEHDEVQLTDPVSRYLPPDVRMPDRNRAEVTLENLATHTSGLPRMPSNVDPRDPFNPYADYSTDRLYTFLSTYQLTQDIGSRFEYSNLGGALLAQVLSRRAGADFATMVEQRIAGPLGMPDTRVSMTPEMSNRFAHGHGYGLEEIPSWDMGALAGAGGLHSTANDLLTFLEAELGYKQTPLQTAMSAMLNVRHATGRGEVGLAWFVEFHRGAELVFHSGSTGGYLSFIGYDPKSKRGAVVLSNSGTGPGVDDIGMHLLNPKVPLLDSTSLTPPTRRTEVSLESIVLDRYTGRYRFPSGQMATITREGNHLYLQGEGDVKLAFYPEDAESFFAKLIDAQITFNLDERDRVTRFLFRRGGYDFEVERVD